MKIAVVTGASSGMGREFVYALDRQQKFDEIWVLARREARLQELKSRTRARIRPIPCDLLKRESISAYETLLKKEQPTVAVLVNAAGFGLFGTFEKMSMVRIVSSDCSMSMGTATAPALVMPSSAASHS